MRHAKRMGQLIYCISKNVFGTLRKSPELQLVTVLLIGIIASSLIIFGFTVNDAGVPSLPVTTTAAQNLVMDIAEYSGH
ncbi:MAG: hypothetical protein GY869_20835 [Planctomycetes bacterium]|nr:hypothetical protein [Planctomycetota bacterium]